MIIVNGYMQVLMTTGGGMKNGIPIPVEETLSCSIPCNIKTIKHNRKGMAIDGVFTQSSYEVLIDTITTDVFSNDRIILTDNRNQKLGEFRVQDIQHLDCIGAIKIVV